MGFERIDAEEVFEGQLLTLHKVRFRHDDGEEVAREVVTHPGAVAILAHDGERLYMVTQPREAVGEEALLELPAGKMDEEGEDALATAKRELREEIGKAARSWRPLTRFYMSPAFTDEEMHLYLATDLEDDPGGAVDDERIEVEAVPLDRLGEAIARCRDAKSLVGLLWLEARGAGG